MPSRANSRRGRFGASARSSGRGSAACTGGLFLPPGFLPVPSRGRQEMFGYDWGIRFCSKPCNDLPNRPCAKRYLRGGGNPRKSPGRGCIGGRLPFRLPPYASVIRTSSMALGCCVGSDCLLPWGLRFFHSLRHGVLSIFKGPDVREVSGSYSPARMKNNNTINLQAESGAVSGEGRGAVGCSNGRAKSYGCT